jgi:hypothetical protein
MSGCLSLLIGAVACALLAEYARRKLFTRYRKRTGSLVRALSPQARRRYRIYVITGLGLRIITAFAVGFFIVRFGLWASQPVLVAVLWFAFFISHTVRTAAGWALGLYPAASGFRACYIVEHVPLSRLLVDLALALPIVGFA